MKHTSSLFKVIEMNPQVDGTIGNIYYTFKPNHSRGLIVTIQRNDNLFQGQVGLGISLWKYPDVKVDALVYVETPDPTHPTTSYAKRDYTLSSKIFPHNKEWRTFTQRHMYVAAYLAQQVLNYAQAWDKKTWAELAPGIKVKSQEFPLNSKGEFEYHGTISCVPCHDVLEFLVDHKIPFHVVGHPPYAGDFPFAKTRKRTLQGKSVIIDAAKIMYGIK